MRTMCECGMAIEHRARLVGCRECGTRCCASCSLEVDAMTYCRWCATSTAPARPA